MKILIICSSLEKGKDGVGDYSRKLGAWLSQRSFKTQILAFNDKFLLNREFRSDSISRFSSGLNLKLRQKKLQEIIDAFEPDILFLQYVPYGFHRKGIPLKLAKVLGSIRTSGKWFIMIHEPYIGGSLGAREKLVQFAQKKALKRLVKKTKPKRVFTSIKKYERALADIQIVSSILPLFGNIQFSEMGADRDDSVLTGVYFGAPPKKQNYQFFRQGLIEISVKYKLKIYICGKTNDSDFKSYLRSSFVSKNIELIDLGELSEEKLSQLFRKVNFGIARIAPDLIGKSGSAISLLEHGVKLWIPLAKTQEEIAREVLFRPNLCFARLSDLTEDESNPKLISNLDKVGKLLINQINIVA